MPPIDFAKSAERGMTFSLSDSSVLNSCIPPTFRNGRTEKAMMMIPIPPSHCRIARHISKPLGIVSKPTRTVDPVVVRPETDSKKASQKEMSSSESQKGSAEKMLRNIQQQKIIKNPLLGVRSIDLVDVVKIIVPPK